MNVEFIQMCGMETTYYCKDCLRYYVETEDFYRGHWLERIVYKNADTFYAIRAINAHVFYERVLQFINEPSAELVEVYGLFPEGDTVQVTESLGAFAQTNREACYLMTVRLNDVTFVENKLFIQTSAIIHIEKVAVPTLPKRHITSEMVEKCMLYLDQLYAERHPKEAQRAWSNKQGLQAVINEWKQRKKGGM